MGEITAAIPDGIKTGGSSPEATRTKVYQDTYVQRQEIF